MGWLKARHRRWPLEPATFAQTVAIAQDVLASWPAELLSTFDAAELTKRRHLTLGFQYDNQQIHRALSALQDPARRSNKPSGRSTCPSARRSGANSRTRYAPR